MAMRIATWAWFSLRAGPLGSTVHFWEYSASQDDCIRAGHTILGPKDAFDRRFESAGKPRQDKKACFAPRRTSK